MASYIDKSFLATSKFTSVQSVRFLSGTLDILCIVRLHLGGVVKILFYWEVFPPRGDWNHDWLPWEEHR